MSYVVLARKWRPMSFRDLVGQEHVSRTLANAIQQERVAHAFLFTGVRGVGKTTSARILAKALNCLEPKPAEAGGSEPCLACAACREIAEGMDVDVREIDAASYTGVDEIRKLQESLPYRPTRDRYKIFIVDEVHMLSQNAWNALLKTLEEPPPHVKFILATTEVHKVPVTILSRVQRFDFKMISSRLIGERVRYVLAQEQIEADDQAVALVAREAAGSMRDALSLLDQVIAFSPKHLIGDEVARVLGVAGYGALLEIARAVLAGKPALALEAVARLADQSCDLSVAARDLLGLLRDLVVAKLCADADDLLDLSDEHRDQVRELAGTAEADDLLRLQHGFAKGFDDVVRSAEPRTALEMLLARLALRPPLVPIDRLLARLSELEARLAGKPPPSSPGRAGPSGGGGSPRSQQPSRSSAGANAAGANAAGANAAGANAAEADASGAAAPTSARPERSNGAARTSPTAGVMLLQPAATGHHGNGSRLPPSEVSSSALGPPEPPPRVPPGAARSVAPASNAVMTEGARAAPAGAGSGSPVAPVADAPPSTPPAGEETGATLEAWRRVLDHLGEERPDLVAFLKHSVPLVIAPDTLTLGYESGNVLETAMRSAESLEALGRAALACFGRQPKISFQPVAAGTETLAESDKRAREQRKRAAVHRAEQHPSVKDAAEILGARVKRIEVGEA